MDERQRDQDLEPALTDAGDPVGPGSGGSPSPPGIPDTDERADAASDEDVASLVRELRTDAEGAEVDVTEAAEETGTGTDR